MPVNSDKKSHSPKRRKHADAEPIQPKLSRVGNEDPMLGDQPNNNMKPEHIPVDIVPGHSNDLAVDKPVEKYYPSKEYARTILGRERHAKAVNGDQTYNPNDKRYATPSLDVKGVQQKVEYVAKRQNGTLDFLKEDRQNIFIRSI
ncbi:hypothetical protein AVEN_117947-1 [Araneus ventricosus]|uniref:Uncharacterized protein n=1 Tax=Araneus ventricosus TaxID=182803 RepID=A0A4Y2KSD9_ARAVE|nr:hypothetical protein AVEN_117947-1 [Araneus ventricosus]